MAMWACVRNPNTGKDDWYRLAKMRAMAWAVDAVLIRICDHPAAFGLIDRAAAVAAVNAICATADRYAECVRRGYITESAGPPP
jgi:hypothetical protein